MRATYQRADKLAEVKLINYLCDIGRKELITATDGDGYNALQRNALHFACHHAQPNLKVIKILIAGGAFELLQQDKEGKTPLHLACKASYEGCANIATTDTVEVVKYLIKQEGGKDLARIEDNDNDTATSLAIRKDFPLDFQVDLYKLKQVPRSKFNEQEHIRRWGRVVQANAIGRISSMKNARLVIPVNALSTTERNGLVES